MGKITLYPYQQAIVDDVFKEWAKPGIYRTLVHAATGVGKTEVSLSVLSGELSRYPDMRILFLVHTIELVSQPIERIDTTWPEFFGMTGIVQADQNDVSARFIVATWQSLTRGRLDDILAFGKITHLVLDECHRSVATGIDGIVEKLKAVNPEIKVLGLTATPKRTDKVGLTKIFQTVAHSFPINKAIAVGALAPFKAFGVQLPADLSEVRQTKNGYDDDEVGKLLSAENILEIVYDNWSKFCRGRQTIGFTASVEQAEKAAAYFCSRGEKAAAVSGKTPKADRARIISDFKSGNIDILFNVFVLVEGFDHKPTSAVMMIAPTKSDLVYIQRAGRALRIAPGKTDAVIIDFAPEGSRDMIMAGDILGINRAAKKAIERAEKQELLFALDANKLGQISAVDPSELIISVLNLLSHHRLAWYADEHGAVTSLGEKTALYIEMPNFERLKKAEDYKSAHSAAEWTDAMERVYQDISQYGLWLVERGRATFYGRYATIDDAKTKGDDIAEYLEAVERDRAANDDTYRPSISILSDKDKRWRKDPATRAQIAMIERLGISAPASSQSDGYIRKGQAAQMITAALTRQAIERAKTISTRGR